MRVAGQWSEVVFGAVCSFDASNQEQLKPLLHDLAYDLATRTARLAVSAVAPLNYKLLAGVEGRAAALAKLREWSGRRPDARLIWVHAPSVGESLMAQAIVHAVRGSMPDAQIAFTHFSPSAERVVDRVGADVTAYLPWDTHADMQAALHALRPAAIVFVRSEIWPGLVRLAANSGIPSLLVNAVLAPSSSRLRPLARMALGPAYRRLSAVGAIDEPTARRFEQLGVTTEKIVVTGDARFDQVWTRVQSLNRNSPLLNRLRESDMLTVVAGSTWPSDEEKLLPAIAPFIFRNSVRLIIAAHEPTEAHMAQQESALAELGIGHARLVEVESSSGPLPRAIVVDRLGVLADLYAIADLAFVGGGFHGAGLHSVVEPAALGVAVLFGPHHTNAAEAADLMVSGGGFMAQDGTELSALLERLITVPAHRNDASRAARTFVEDKLGAANANAALIAAQIARD